MVLCYWKCPIFNNWKATITTKDIKLIKINGQENVTDPEELIKRGHIGHEALTEEDIATKLSLQTIKSRAASESTTPLQINKEEQCKLVKNLAVWK